MEALKFWIGFLSGFATGTLVILLYIAATEGPDAVVEIVMELWPK